MAATHSPVLGQSELHTIIRPTGFSGDTRQKLCHASSGGISRVTGGAPAPRTPNSGATFGVSEASAYSQSGGPDNN